MFPRRDPSFVDRQRLDSDVRAFLRQPSTPWMVFDRDEVSSTLPPEPEPAAPFVGSVLAGSGSSVVREEGFFPQTDSYAPEAPVVEASTAAVVTELADAPSAEVAIEALPQRSRAWAPITGAIVVALAGAGLCAALFSPSTRGEAATKKSAAAAMSLDAPPPNLDPKPEPKTEKPVSAPAAPVTKAVSTSKFGKLTITGAATRHQVFMDGKRFLGTGTRSFTVMCGTHAIGIDSRTDTKDLEVPCGGELTISE